MLSAFPRCSAAAAAVLIAAIVGCSAPGADESFEAARAHLAKRDFASATVELMNALQARPDWAEARFLLGKALLERGDAVAAAVELRKARDLKFDDEQVVPLLAKAMTRTTQSHRVIELDATTVLTTPEAIADFKASVALAYASQGRKDKADAAIAAALKAKPDHVPALLLRARSLASAGDYDAAMPIVDRVLAAGSSDAEALALKGELLESGLQDEQAAAALYRKVLEIAPDHLGAHSRLLSQLLGRKDLEGAKAQLEAMRKVRGGHPQTVLFEARLAVQQGDFKTAGTLVQRLLKVGGDNREVLLLAGIVALSGNELRQAEQHFNKVVQLEPRAPAPRRMLARAHLRSGNAALALAALEPLLQARSPDAKTLSLAGSAYLQAGELRKAQELLARAAQLDPADVRSRTALALAHVAMGEADTGIEELESAAGSDSGTTADLALINTSMRQRKFDVALKAIERLEKKQPGKPLAFDLRARVALAQGDMAAARSNFEKAVAADPKFLRSIDGLAALDLRDGKAVQARARFEALLKEDPTNARALLGLALLEERAGRPKEDVARSLAKAVAASPREFIFREKLVQFHLSRQDYHLALAAAQDAASAAPDDFKALRLLSVAQLATGQKHQAIHTLNKLVLLEPRSPRPLLALAGTYLAVKSPDRALEAAAKALALAPHSPSVLREVIKIDVLAGRTNEALTKAKAEQRRSPKADHGWLLEGEIEMMQRNWQAAETAFRTALHKRPTTAAAQRLHQALVGAGEKHKAAAFETSWTKAHPRDADFLLYLARSSMADKSYASAAAQLEQVVRITPDNAEALNNLAWVQAMTKAPGAVATAHRALELMPNQPAFLDTLAHALEAEGNVAQAAQVQRRAVALAPSTHRYRLTLARLLILIGDKTAARDELDALATLGDRFGQQDEVRALQGKL